METTPHFREEFSQFVSKNVHHLICKTYAPAKHSKPGKETDCGCGRTMDWHNEKNMLAELKGQPWDSEIHTTSVAPCCFGTIDFAGFGTQNNNAAFVRVPAKISTERIWWLLEHVWKLPPPKLVISVTGGAKKLQLKPRLQHAFTQGLIDVASTTDAWIISGGMSAGVMQWVGQAVNEHTLANKHLANHSSLVALGIAPWGGIDNIENLQGEEYVGCFPAHYKLQDCRDSEKVPLDHNHTHFLLVDDGTERKWGTEIELRARLEAQIASTSYASDIHGRMKIPVVMVVCEGGDKTLKTVWDATAQHKIPAVIMKGSGRAADLLSFCYKSTKPLKNDDSKTFFNESFDEIASRLIQLAFGWSDSQTYKIDENLKEVKDLLNNRHLITIFEIDDLSCRDLDKAVLTALLKANKTSTESQINLALTWDRADIARQYIFTMENRMFWQKYPLAGCMFDALLKERREFVQLFMENGIDLTTFLTVDRLRTLYLASLSDDSCRMVPIIKSLIKSSATYTSLSIMRCNQIDESDRDDLILPNIEKVLRYLLKDKFAYIDVSRTKSDDNVSTTIIDKPLEMLMNLNQIVVRMDPNMDLFTWCLLFNKKVLAQFFWKSSKDPIGGALFACNVLKALAAHASAQEELDLCSDLRQQVDMYETVAADILYTCYSKDKSSAQNLLTRKLDQSWLGTTLLSLAENASLMKFMQMSCCQTKLNKIWTGCLTENTPDWKVMLGLIPGFLFFLRFRNDDDINYDVPPAGEVISKSQKLEEELSINESGKHSKMANGSHENEKNQNQNQKFFYATLAFCSGKSQTGSMGKMGFLKAYYRFFSAPVTKFYTHTLSYSMFLAMFTYVTLAQLQPLEQKCVQGYVEMVLWFWVLSLWIEEMRQILTKEAKSIGYKIVNHFKSFWNQLDFCMFAFFLASVIIRNVGDNGDRVMYAKVTYALSLMFAYLRLMETFNVSKVLGPKIVAIQKMLKDLLVFICLLVVFILSFGVAMQAILYSRSPFDFDVFLKSLYSPYWQTFGGANVARAEGRDDPDCTDNDTALELDPSLHPCPRHGYLVPALLAIYVLLTNVLLLNLLIAMFSNTFQKVQENSEKLWRFYRYSLIKAYYDAPTLPPPFIIIGHVTQLFMYFCHKKIKPRYRMNNAFCVSLSEQETKGLSAFEKAGQESYLATTDKLSMDSVDNQLATTRDKLDQAIDQLDEIRDKLHFDKKPSNDNDACELDSQTKANSRDNVERKLTHIESQMERQNRTIQMLLSVLDKKLHLLDEK